MPCADLKNSQQSIAMQDQASASGHKIRWNKTGLVQLLKVVALSRPLPLMKVEVVRLSPGVSYLQEVHSAVQ